MHLRHQGRKETGSRQPAQVPAATVSKPKKSKQMIIKTAYLLSPTFGLEVNELFAPEFKPPISGWDSEATRSGQRAKPPAAGNGVGAVSHATERRG